MRIPGRILLAAVLAAATIPTAAGQSVPLAGRRLYVDPGNPARRQAAEWARSRAADAALMRRMGDQPQAIWLGDWNANVRGEVQRVMSQAARAGAVPVLVAYNIPYRDCGLHSRGGASGADNYRRWILEVARGIDRRPAIVVLEPDAVAALDCLPARQRDERYVLVREAVDVLTKAGATVYVDAGHANWRRAADMAERLRRAGVPGARGFALNVSNFQPTPLSIAYGNQVSRLTGGKRYVIDTSRNGRGGAAKSEWCNPPNQALGPAPTLDTGTPLADAFLWVKIPGQSDGACNGGPRAGEWWPAYALGLARTAETLGSMTQR